MLPRSLVTATLLALGISPVGAGEVAVLYDPDALPGVTQTPNEQGFWRLSSDLLNQDGFFSAGDGVTDFDSGPGPGQVAVLFTHGLSTGNPLHPLAQILDRSQGFRVSIDLAIDFEEHDAVTDINGDGTPDSAGFSMALMASDSPDPLGIGFSFWSDRVWVNDDIGDETQVLAQAEGIAQDPADMARLRRYEVEVIAEAYRLRIDGITRLTGRLRDYRAFAGIGTGFGGSVLNNFDKPNSITIGDATQGSRSRVRIGEIVSETPHAPEADPLFEIGVAEGGGIALRWGAVPGTSYSIQAGDNLRDFEEINDQVATRFVEDYTDTRPRVGRRFYRVLPIVAP